MSAFDDLVEEVVDYILRRALERRVGPGGATACPVAATAVIYTALVPTGTFEELTAQMRVCFDKAKAQKAKAQKAKDDEEDAALKAALDPPLAKLDVD